ncbi:hypothetical protein PTKIN_Ptkin09bG0142000 [Pterospermum kingtungense]
MVWLAVIGSKIRNEARVKLHHGNASRTCQLPPHAETCPESVPPASQINIEPAYQLPHGDTEQGSEFINEQGAVEIKVETDDKQSQVVENKEPGMENLGVVHLTRDGHNSGTKGGFLASEADAVAKASQSAKDAISGSGQGSSNKY